MDLFTKLMLAGACLSALAWAVVAQRRTVRRISDAYLRLSHVQRALVLLALVICTVHAQKPSTNDVEGVTGTNEVEIVEGGGDADQVDGASGEADSCPLQQRGELSFLTSGQESASPLSVTTFSSPYRQESVSTNSDISYAMPADATVRGTRHLTGAYEDVQNEGCA